MAQERSAELAVLVFFFTLVVHLEPEGVFRPAYKVGGAAPVLAGVAFCHVGQFQLRVRLGVFTDHTLQRRGQEVRPHTHTHTPQHSAQHCTHAALLSL